MFGTGDDCGSTFVRLIVRFFVRLYHCLAIGIASFVPLFGLALADPCSIVNICFNTNTFALTLRYIVDICPCLSFSVLLLLPAACFSLSYYLPVYLILSVYLLFYP